MKVYTFWIHGLEREHSWTARNRVEASSGIMNALDAGERERVERLELLEEAVVADSAVFSQRKASEMAGRS